MRHVGQHEREPVAAQPRHRVLIAQRVAQALRDQHEHAVVGVHTEPVVDGPEVVEVEHRHARAAAGALGLGDRALQAIVEHGAVGQPGQRVGPAAEPG